MICNHLNPKEVFYYFEEISRIPRGSGNEQAVAEYVEAFAKARGLFVIRDKNNNVFVRRPASHGRENSPAVVLQGHLDMVCEANSNVVHDFTKDPIQLLLDGDILRANGTTLGADNGVAVAIMLALLDSDTFSLPELECLFTTEEETGLAGMTSFDASVVKGRLMINLDSAGEGEATVSCAGGVRTHITFPADKLPLSDEYTAARMKLSGLAGGHSGEDINLGRTNAIAAAARILLMANDEAAIQLVSVNGGSKDNAIPRECEVVFAANDLEGAKEAILREYHNMKLSLAEEDMAFTVAVSDVSGVTESMSGGMELLRLLNIIPIGVHTMSRGVPGLVETSSNLGVVKTEGDGVYITVSSRSSVSTELDYMQKQIESAAVLAGALTMEHKSRYPGWEFTRGSSLQQLYLRAYRDLFGTEARIIGIHAGLECGIFKQKVPDMDIISIGPVIKNLHSPDETLSVSSLERLYTLLLEMLKRV